MGFSFTENTLRTEGDYKTDFFREQGRVGLLSPGKSFCRLQGD